MRWAIVAAGVLVAPAALAKTVTVTNGAELGAAISAAQAGDVIELADGTYDSTGYSCNASGTTQTPITVRAKNAHGATVRFDALEGFKVGGDFWHFEGLVVKGVCANDSNCEHAFHVNGASGFVLRGSIAVDFNAQLKVNAVLMKLPQGGLVEGNEIYDSRARNTSNPTTKLNIDSGDDWIVRGNVLHDFQKGAGDNVSYGAFLKCGGLRGIMERNLVMCARDFSGGTRIGLSLGGGGCAPQFCEPSFNANVPCLEHTDGIVRNNIIASCSDVGVYVNQSKNSRVHYNTLIATSGIDFRFAMTTGEARGNVLAGTIRNRDGSTGMFANNLESVGQATFDGFYVAPMMGDLRKKGDLSTLIGKGMTVPVVTDDYCARTRTAPFDLGALQHSLGDCDTKMGSDAGTGTDGGNGDGGGNGSGDGGGSDGGTGGGNGGGCSCETTPAGSGFGIFGLLFAGLTTNLWRRASRHLRSPRRLR